MGGCFGNDPIDKWMERQVDAYNGGDILEDILDEVEEEYDRETDNEGE